MRRFATRPGGIGDSSLAPPTWFEKDDWFNDAARRLEAAGLSVLAWMVMTHEDDFGAQHPDLAVRNAFDDIYPYALCPSSEEVRAYCRTLVEEVLRTTESAGVVLEACGPFGVEHGSIHDKSDMAGLSESEKALLSVCFCVACLHALDEFGLDGDALADAVRVALSGPVGSLDAALGQDVATQLGQFRAGLVLDASPRTPGISAVRATRRHRHRPRERLALGNGIVSRPRGHDGRCAAKERRRKLLECEDGRRRTRRNTSAT